ncbi:MAG: protein kinase [Myxococcales bacterium]|nr:protein kinase [Myxococcales bacterium]
MGTTGESCAAPVLRGRYQCEALLGQGGMGEVYRCRDEVTGRVMALKRLKPKLVSERPALGLLFETEFYTLRELSHPSIIKVFDYGVDDDGTPYYTMELLEGAQVRTAAPLAWREACAVLRDVASCLAMLHSRRLLHRDVTPRNVLRDAQGRSKLLDFGTMATFGTAGQVVGTLPCMPPEALNGQALDARADLYSLGALGYFVLSGRHAYPANGLTMLRDLWRSRPVPLGSLAPDAPPELVGLIQSLLSLNSLARPASASEVIERLTVIAGLPADEDLAVAHAYLRTPPLLAREAQLARMRKQLLRAREGRGSVVVIEGGAGTGRSRLCEAVELEGKLVGATSVRVESMVVGGAQNALMERLARGLCEQEPDLCRTCARPFREGMARVLPGLRDELDLPSPEALAEAPLFDDALGKSIIAVADWIEAIAKQRMLVLVLDDLESADATSQAAIGTLARRASELRLAMVVAVLPAGGEETATLDGLRREHPVQHLRALSEEESERLLGSLFGAARNLRQIAHWVYQRALGNPRTTMELSQHLVERGIVRYEQGSWILPESVRGQGLPSTLEDMLRLRLAELSRDALRLLGGLAVAEVPIALEEYALLLGGTDANERVAAASSELVGAGILVRAQDTYHIAQQGYIDTVVQIVDDQERLAIHRRVAELFEGRGDVALQSSHLMKGGEELVAVDAVLAWYKRNPIHAGVQARPQAQAVVNESVPATVATRKRMVDICERLGRPALDKYLLRVSIVRLANGYDPSLSRGMIRPLIGQLAHDMGLQHWDALGESAPGKKRIQHCLERAQATYDATPEYERVQAPLHAVKTCVLVLGLAQNYARQAVEVELLAWLLHICDRIAYLSPRLGIVRKATLHSYELARGRLGVAATIRHELLEYYREGALPNDPSYVVSQVGRAILIHAEGLSTAVRGGESAERWAALLEDPLQGLPEEGNVVRRSPHVWVRRAWEIRHLMHLFSGDARRARDARERVERLTAGRSYAAYGGGAAHIEARAHALCGDLIGLKQCIEILAQIVAQQHPAWEPFLLTARGDYHALRGEPHQALAYLERVIASTGPGKHGAWVSAVASYVQVKLALGHSTDARATASEAVQACTQADLGSHAQHHLRRVLALAEAQAGDTERALSRLERLIEYAKADGVDGVRMGELYEAVARVHLAAGDGPAFYEAVARTGDRYLKLGSASLVAKHERLLQAGRDAGLSSLSEPPRDLAAPGAMDAGQAGTVALGIELSEDPFLAALSMLLEHTDTDAGFLFLWQNGELRVVAGRPDTSAPPALLAALRPYLLDEEQDLPDVTMTFVSDARTELPALHTQPDGRKYFPVIINDQEGDQTRLLGAAALLDAGRAFRIPDHTLVSSLAEGLRLALQSQTALSVFDPG